MLNLPPRHALQVYGDSAARSTTKETTTSKPLVIDTQPLCILVHRVSVAAMKTKPTQPLLYATI
jgi:hypothetical protein